MKKEIIVIEKKKEECTLKTDGKIAATDVAEMLLTGLCIAVQKLVRDGIFPVKVLRDVTINTLEKVFKELESEGKEDETAKEVEA